jgi:hypothetical protein
VTEAQREWAVQYPTFVDGEYDRVIKIDPMTGRPFDQQGAERLVRTEQNTAANVEDYKAIPYRVVYRDVPEWTEYEE